MSLITTCPACNTSFRVIAEQLSAHRGDVRCGQCQHIFNALRLLEEVPGQAVLPEALQDEIPNVHSAGATEATELTPSDDFVEPDQDDYPENLSEPLEAWPEAPSVIESHSELENKIPSEDDETFAEIHQGTVSSENYEIQDPVFIDAATSDLEEVPAEPVAENPEESFDQIEITPAESDPGTKSEFESEASHPRDETQLDEGMTEPLDFDLDESAPELSSDTDGQETSQPLEDQADGSDGSQDLSAIEPEPASIDDVIDVTTPLPEALTSPDSAQNGQLPTVAKTSVTDQPESAEQIQELVSRQRTPGPLLGLVVLLLLLGAFAQVAYFLRTEITVIYPPARPWLERACEYLSCKVELPRQADLLNIEDSDLQTDPQHEGVLVLVSALYNRAPYAQAFPMLEVTLTDTYDKPILRRTLTPQEYLAPEPKIAAGIPANGEARSRLYLDVAGEKPAGYRLFVRY